MTKPLATQMRHNGYRRAMTYACEFLTRRIAHAAVMAKTTGRAEYNLLQTELANYIAHLKAVSDDVTRD